MSTTDDFEKKFVMNHFFKNVKNQIIDGGDGAEMSGPVEEHFGVEWKLRIRNDEDDCIDFHLDCLHPDQSSDWKIEAKLKVYVNGTRINKGTHCFANISQSVYVNIDITDHDEFSINDNMQVEIRVTIVEMTGIKKEKLRQFDDEKAKNHSDMVLMVGDQQFYVNKMHLSLHCDYFESLFSQSFAESKKSEIELKDIDPNDFQNFLELIYGEYSINDITIEGILHLADFFISKGALEKCQKFLMRKSELSLKRKFNAAIKGNLDDVKRKCMSEMKTKEDVESVIPEDHKQLDTSVWAELFKKVTSF